MREDKSTYTLLPEILNDPTNPDGGERVAQEIEDNLKKKLGLKGRLEVIDFNCLKCHGRFNCYECELLTEGELTMQCSDLFVEALDSHVSGYVRVFESGKTYFDGYNNWDDWYSGELEGLKKDANDYPDRYIAVDGSVGTISIDGKEIVIGCDCGRARVYEDFIIAHAEQLARYLNKYDKNLEERADKIKVE